MSRQTEPGGITYDRYRLDQIFHDLTARHGLRTALEVQAGGEKAMPSIYSLGLARAGCTVTLLNPVPSALSAWAGLGLQDRVRCLAGDPLRVGLSDRSFDLVWNFVSLARASDFRAALVEMKRLSRGLVLTVHTSAYNVGYPWHRLIHRVFGFPWTHGDTRLSFPGEVKAAYRAAGLRIVRVLPFDSPPWPDPPGFRDVRLHRLGIDTAPQEEVLWAAPILDYCREDRFPLWMTFLSRIERLPIPRVLRYPVSHLFLVLAQVPS